MNNMKEYYFSILIQDTELINEIDNVVNNTDFNACQYVADMFCGIGFEDDVDNFTDYKPYICQGSDSLIATYGDFTLVRNMAICGDYMLYRKAYEDEVEWLTEVK